MDCCICKNQIYGHSHNAQPLANGRCCSDCNGLVVQHRIDRHLKYRSMIDNLKKVKTKNEDTYRQIIEGIKMSIKLNEQNPQNIEEAISLYKSVLIDLGELK